MAETKKDKPTILKELAERVRSGDISIGEILVAQNRANRTPFPSDNENRLAEEVARTQWGGKAQVDLRQVPKDPLLASLSASGEAASITVEPLLAEAYQIASSVEGSDTTKLNALKGSIQTLGRRRQLSVRAKVLLNQIIDHISLNEQRHDASTALRLFSAEFLDANAPNEDNVSLTGGHGETHRLPQGEVPDIGQGTIGPSDSSNQGKTTGRVLERIPAPIPFTGDTVARDKPPTGLSENLALFEGIGKLSYGLSKSALSNLYYTTVSLKGQADYPLELSNAGPEEIYLTLGRELVGMDTTSLRSIYSKAERLHAGEQP